MDQKLLEEFRRAVGLPGDRFPEYRQPRTEAEGALDVELAAANATKDLLAQMGKVRGLWGDYIDALHEKGLTQSASGQHDKDQAERIQKMLTKAASTVEDAAKFWLKP